MIAAHEMRNQGAFLLRGSQRVPDKLNITIDYGQKRIGWEKRQTKLKKLHEDHTGKYIYSMFYKSLNNQEKLSFAFSKSAGLKSETERIKNNAYFISL